MRSRYLFVAILVVFFSLVPFLPTRVSGQASSTPSRISAAVDNSKLTTLRGNVHPMARAAFDRGAAPASLQMDHMLLVLTRSTAQQAELETLLAQQQDRSSPNYHKWLTPEQFGQQFGPSDQDVQAVTSWLQSQGFHINDVAKGRTLIDFSGTAGQVQQAFHTAMHSYVLADGRQHWANSTDPQIPAALTPVVAGVASLNNFPRKAMSHSFGVVRRSKATGRIKALNPNFTFAGGCNGSDPNCYAVGPGDFATIYNSQALLNAGTNGSGQTIAIVSDSDISLSDVVAFRSIFGLPAGNVQVIETGTPPGPTVNEIEAVLDVEWAGAVAPGAAIDLVVSPTTNSAFGGDTSANYIINHNLAGILGYSYGLCELDLGTSGNAMYQTMWSQAALQGITVVVSTGDNGSAGCEAPDPNNLSTSQEATTGLAVNGVASTPYNIAVGGTDFNDSANPATYWSTTSGNLNSAKSYIPEVAYNDSCTNAILSTALFGGFSTVAEANCNNALLIDDGGPNGINLISPFGGSGGVSNCTTNGSTATSNAAPSTCSGGYAKPTWQTGPGVPNDGKRDLPDVSLFSGDGFLQNFYVICEADQDPGNAACNLNSPFQDFSAVGGTSVAAQAFTGIVALIDQKTNSRQGNLNPTLYALAAEQSAANCNASGTPAASCTFNDVTSGTIAMPCAKGSPNCNVNFSSDSVGILSGYNAGTGFDLATGLGSVNIGNLVNNFGPNFYLSSSGGTSTPVVTIASPGASGTMTVTVYGASTNQPALPFTGTVTLACSNLPTGATCSFSGGNGFTSPNIVTLSASTTSVPVTVTVNTTSASKLIPGSRPWNPRNWVTSGAAAMTLALLAFFLVRVSKRESAGRSFAMLVLLCSMVTAIAACGGGSSSSTNSGGSNSPGNTTGPTGNTSSVLTGTSGSTNAVMNFTVTIQ